ncbi:transglutaminase-like domain-containing protein [Flavobacterium sp.]|uniref:transglutaminase-like domain-containing protein n=1 Tax=Flavobacterium sp. TaxID=239 RepID=UPI00286E7ADB|nr:transglutaminase-like domain-containing protein [Flavobacterium sp.]
MIKIKIFLCSILIASVNLVAQTNESDKLKIKALRTLLAVHYQSDAEKQKAAAFLIDNLDIHASQNYNWIDHAGKKVPFNELDYANSEMAVQAFKKLNDSIKIKPQTYELKDSEALTPELLIKNIDLAFDAWRNNPWSKAYDFATFCEYILPYRSLTEPLEDWREDYQFLVSSVSTKVENNNMPIEVGTSVLSSLKNFKFLESRPDPIPFLSPKQLLFRREGSCNDLANLAILACRSVGLAVTFDFTPFYGASSNKHFWNTIITEKGEHIPFNGISSDNPEGLPYNYKPTQKRLAKVYRKTYSIQQNSLANIELSGNIPDGFLKEKNVLDVTDEYVTTGKISIAIQQTNPATIGYLNVFNLGSWRTIDWAKKTANSCEFKNLGINIVYLPSFYQPETKKRTYETYPILLDSDKNQIVLKPNYERTFSFDITRDIKIKGPTKDFNSFEVFENEIFNLLVWDNGWKKIETATAQNKAIHFTKIPDNGLFLLLCKKSNGYERIFRINTETRQIEWY